MYTKKDDPRKASFTRRAWKIIPSTGVIRFLVQHNFIKSYESTFTLQYST